MIYHTKIAVDVEDSERLSLINQRLLNEHGYSVRGFSRPDDAVRHIMGILIIKPNKPTYPRGLLVVPEIVVASLDLAGYNGLTFLRNVRDRIELAGTKRVLLVGPNDDLYQDVARQALREAEGIHVVGTDFHQPELTDVLHNQLALV